MRIKKVYESGNVHFNANLLAKKLSKKFFGHIDEFEKIFVREDIGKSFLFYICFNEAYKETIKALEDFHEFMGRVGKDQWGLQLDSFDDNYYMYDFISISNSDIDKYLEKIDIEENAKKYNI